MSRSRMQNFPRQALEETVGDVPTDPDAATDLAAFREEVCEGLRQMAGSGGIRDIYAADEQAPAPQSGFPSR